jgi:hypothetical protein
VLLTLREHNIPIVYPIRAVLADELIGEAPRSLARPNLRYAGGVRLVADFARRMLEHAAVLSGPAAGRHFAAAGH